MNNKSVSRRQFFKFGLVMVSAGVLTGVGLIAADALNTEAQPPTPTPIVTATTLPDISLDVQLMLVVEDGEILFYDQPEGMPTQYLTPKGTLLNVTVREQRNVNGTEWFYLELNEVDQRGWVRGSELLNIGVMSPVVIDDFQFCLGSAAQPTGPCAPILPLDGTEVWLTYHFKGLKRGAVVQTVVVVNGEQYQSTPQIWNSGSEGTQMLPLVQTHKFPMDAGMWTVMFYVDGELKAESSVQIRS